MVAQLLHNITVQYVAYRRQIASHLLQLVYSDRKQMLFDGVLHNLVHCRHQENRAIASVIHYIFLTSLVLLFFGVTLLIPTQRLLLHQSHVTTCHFFEMTFNTIYTIACEQNQYMHEHSVFINSHQLLFAKQCDIHMD